MGALVVFAILLPVVVVLAVVAADNSRRLSEARFQQNANQASVRTQSVLDAYFDKLRDQGAFLSATPQASRAQFAEFVRHSEIFQDLPTLNSVLYVERVAAGELEAFQAQRRLIEPTFTVIEYRPPPPGGDHLILMQYVPGATTVELPVGFDVGFLPMVTGLADLTETSGHGVAASIQDDEQVKDAILNTLDGVLNVDFYIAAPVYTTTPDGNPRGEFQGAIVAGVQRFEDVFAAATAGTPEDLGLRLKIDLSKSGLNDRTDLTRETRVEGNAGPEDQAAFREERTFTADGVDFRLGVWSSAEADSGAPTGKFAFFCGLLVALALAALVELRRRSLQEFSERARLQHDILDSATDAMVVLDRSGRVVVANAAWSRLRGDDGAGEGVGQLYLDLLMPAVRQGGERLAEAMQEAIVGSSTIHEIEDMDVLVVPEGGSQQRWYEIRAIRLRGDQGAVVVHTDITERKRTQDAFEFRATHDELTGLANRSAMEAAVDDALLAARSAQDAVALLFIDLDGFKAINDNYGHAVGDEALRKVAQRLSGVVRTTDRLGRLGGDEFVMLLPSIDDAATASLAAERVLDALTEGLDLSIGSVPLGASVGVAIASPGDDRSRLLRRADHAMYQAKQSGGRRFAVASAAPQVERRRPPGGGNPF